jgi:hypothetical protein
VLSLRQKYLDIVSRVMTPGAVGMAVLLGAAAPGAASKEPAGPAAAPAEPVSERLAAIREAVSAVSESQPPAEDTGGFRLAWHNWGNGGFGFGLGAPWANFGFGAPWNNWNNWRNWSNWRNLWGNW